MVPFFFQIRYTFNVVESFFLKGEQMFERIFSNALWYLVRQSDLMTKGVLLVLLVMSVICWTIFFYKILLLRIKKAHLRESLEKMQTVDSIEGLLQVANTLKNSIGGYFLTKSLQSLKHFLQKRADRVITHQEYEFLREQMDQVVHELTTTEEAYLPTLSMCASVSPLLGLFGTIWGLIHAFIRIGELQAADITAVAPGIAEALITTLAGLLVAIPALMMFHYLAGQARFVEQSLYGLADTIAGVIQRVCVIERK